MEPGANMTVLMCHVSSFSATVDVNGLVCAGKKIHEILLDVGNVGVREIPAKYVQECPALADI